MMSARRTRTLVLAMAAGAALVAGCSAIGDTEPTVIRTVPTVAPTTVDERPTLLEEVPPPPPPPAPDPEPYVEPVATTVEELVPAASLRYCEFGTGVYWDGSYRYPDPACPYPAPTTPVYTYEDDMGEWAVICGPNDPRPNAECTVPAN